MLLSAAALRRAGAMSVAAAGQTSDGRGAGRSSAGQPKLPVLLQRGNFRPSLGPGTLCARRSGRSPAALRFDSGEARAPAAEEIEAAGIADEVSLETEVQAESRRSGMAKEKSKSRRSSRRDDQRWYLLAAIASTTGFTALSIAAVIYRFVWQMPASGQLPYAEIFGTFAFACGAAVGMEYWARWAHKALWHASLWNMHESHHKPRDGPFEMNDVFAIINAVPAIALMLYGFLTSGLGPGLCFGAGLGITMFGISYMFVHDGLVHRRFPVGPIADVPYLKKVAAAHQLHHADLFDGVPYGLFLGPKELEEVGGQEELEKVLQKRARAAAAVRK